jgi:hypothetical protein
MDYEVLKKRIDVIISRIEQFGGEVQEVIIEEPANLEKIIETERMLGVKFPKSFKKVIQEFSGNFSIRWFLPDEMEPPHEFRGIFSGTPHWGLDLIESFEEGRKGWIEHVFKDPDNEYDAVWHDKLAFAEVGNGDYLAFDMKASGDDAPIVYLSHDDGEGHGYEIANNFIELIDHWSRVAFVGCEDWQWVPFTKGAESGIIPDGEAAVRFREWLQLDI